jgi:muskelin
MILNNFQVLTGCFSFRPSRSHILRLCKYWIRRQEYEEIARTDPLTGIHYLQTTLSEIIDHKNAKQLKEFHKLASLLFKSDEVPATDEENMMTISLGAFSGTPDKPLKSDDKPTIVCENDSNSLISISSTSSSTSSDFMGKYKREAGIATTTGTSFKYSGQKFEIKSRRSLLFNKLIEMMPEKLNQPKGNLSDFVLV